MSGNEYNTLLIDGNSVFKRGYYGAKDMFNPSGEHVGGLYQFLVFLRKFLEDNIYRKVYVLWDGENSSSMRKSIDPEYKNNKNRKSFDRGLLTEDELHIERFKVKEYLEELFVRQFEYENVEADDLIGYYCNNKEDGELVTICTADRDFMQLVTDEVMVYLTDKRIRVDRQRFISEYGYLPENELLIKAIDGDTSDNIKGLKGVNRNTLFKHFPQLREETVTPERLKELIEKIQKGRVDHGRKRLKKLDDLREFLDSSHFKRNIILMDLTNPIITEDCKEEVDELFYLPLDPEDRSIKNFYQKIKRDGLDGTLDKEYINTDFLIPFKKLMEREKSYC